MALMVLGDGMTGDASVNPCSTVMLAQMSANPYPFREPAIPLPANLAHKSKFRFSARRRGQAAVRPSSPL